MTFYTENGLESLYSSLKLARCFSGQNKLLDENNTDITLVENYNDSGLYVLEVKSKKTDGVLFFSDISEYWTTCTLGVCGTAEIYWFTVVLPPESEPEPETDSLPVLHAAASDAVRTASPLCR